MGRTQFWVVYRATVTALLTAVSGWSDRLMWIRFDCSSISHSADLPTWKHVTQTCSSILNTQ